MKIALQQRARKRSVLVVQPTLSAEATLGALFKVVADPELENQILNLKK